MPDVGVVLKVPEDIHGKLKRECSKHDRSMQKVVLCLIEGWMANGAPDPMTYGKAGERSEAIDREARAGLLRIANELDLLSKRVADVEETKARKDIANRGMADVVQKLFEAGVLTDDLQTRDS
jgi:hypothetical protein